MAEAKYTPGPWSAGDGENIYGPDGMLVACTYCAGRRDPEIEANARTISSLPEMVKALRGVSHFAEEMVNDIAADLQAGGPHSDKAREELERWSAIGAVLAKVEGRQL